MSGIKKSIEFDEIVYEDAKFVADYQEKSFSGYVRHCVKMETQKRLKAIERAAETEIHAYQLLSQSQRSGNATESNFITRQQLLEILNNRNIDTEGQEAGE